MTNLTPLMRQYYAIKNNYPDVLLLFQVGDFYELFADDAKTAAAFLGIALTQRGFTASGEPIPLCGVPVHVLDHYVTKLVRGGFKVAICDQLETAKPGRIVERGISQVLTPGTLTDLKLLDEKSASYICSFFPIQDEWALVFAELLTGQLFITKLTNCSPKLLEAELTRFIPDEILLPLTKYANSFELPFQRLGFVVTREQFDPHAQAISGEIQAWFTAYFSHACALFEQSDAVKNGITVLYSYLKKNNERSLTQLRQLVVYTPDDFLMLDGATTRNLELVKNTQDNTSTNSLFELLDSAATAMGSRMIKKWLLRPLTKREQIEQRLDIITCFIQHVHMLDELRKLLKAIGDLERTVGRIALRRAQLADYISLLRAIILVPEIASLLTTHQSLTLISLISSKIIDFTELRTLLEQSLNADTEKEWIINGQFNPELDRLRMLAEHGAQAIIALEQKEQASTGINSLKIRYNGAHGYGIEVTKTNLGSVPTHYLRIQTLVNRERFTTQELKDLEYDIMRARSDIKEIEKELFEAVKQQVEKFISPLKKLAQALAYLDALQSLAHVACTYSYTRPVFNDQRNFSIIDGRHPVIEKKLGPKFIPNSTNLTDQETVWIITGPNMGGKSTFLRQTALITIMAQMGSFVPAKSADLALVDRIFTRIGAADNVAEGKSTFLVEMEETALICTEATPNSLVILDEVGRGTSTFDGLAIAQAVVEYIYKTVRARCLFATHYHELVTLSNNCTGIASYYAASSKTADGIVLLHKILPGIADGSFGLDVAKLAQLPQPLLERAHEILQELTDAEHNKPKRASNSVKSNSSNIEILQTECAKLSQHNRELAVLQEQQEKELNRHKILAAQLTTLDLEQLTAKQALDLLWQLKEKL